MWSLVGFGTGHHVLICTGCTFVETYSASSSLLSATCFCCRPKGVKEDLQAPLKVSDSVSPQPSGPFKLTRKNIHMRRSHKKERKPRFSLNHASPFRDFKNKIPSPEGLPPKVQALKRGSLDMLRGGPQRTIPALRVRFTPEHLKEVVERMGESKDKEF